jgi:hypothetical protein
LFSLHSSGIPPKSFFLLILLQSNLRTPAPAGTRKKRKNRNRQKPEERTNRFRKTAFLMPGRIQINTERGLQ